MLPKEFSYLKIFSKRFSMDAIIFIGAIPKAKIFGSVTHFICTYCLSMASFNKRFFILALAFFYFDKVSFKDWYHYFDNNLSHYLDGLLTKGPCLFCFRIPEA